MNRLNINSFSADQRATLSGLIQQYTTPSIVEEHANAISSGVHSDPAMFLSFHRSYIGGLESFLSEQGYPQWVPLPAWDPAEPIPEEFNIPNTGPDQLQNLNPNVSFSPEFDKENLVNFATVEELGSALMQRHNLVHQRIGGVMNNQQRAPEAPIFWPFHSFIDDIWWEWQRITVTVPSCIGLSLGQAQKLLGHCGLRVKMPPNHFRIWNWTLIKHQKPAPLTMAPYGTPIKLYF